MTTDNIRNGTGSSFRLRRPPITSSGYTADVDPLVKSHLDELNRLLGKSVFVRPHFAAAEAAGAADGAEKDKDKEKEAKEASAKRDDGAKREEAESRNRPRVNFAARKGIRIDLLTHLPLTPKRVVGSTWEPGSLLEQLSKTEESPEFMTLEQYIDTEGELSDLKYGFAASIAQQKFTLPFNVNAVLQDYPAIVDYLVVFS